MKNIFYKCLIIVLIAFTSCNNKNEFTNAVPDPEGTIIVQVRNNGETSISPTGLGGYYWENETIWGGAYFSIDFDNNLSVVYPTILDNLPILNPGEINCIGKVAGLGNIRKLPKEGWAIISAILPEHGYILRCKSDIDMNGNSTPNGYTYCRLYVVDYIISTEGGIIGATIKYQSPFFPESK